jgi:hypothetical protein
VGTPVEYPGNRIVPFLAARVPKHHFQELLAVHVRRDGRELSPNSDLVVVREGITSNPFYNAAFADARVTD